MPLLPALLSVPSPTRPPVAHKFHVYSCDTSVPMYIYAHHMSVYAKLMGFYVNHMCVYTIHT